MKLFFNAISKFLLGIVVVGLFLFLPVCSFSYPNAWLFIGLLFAPMILLGAILFIKSPKLLEKRLNNKEKEKAQKGVISLSGLIFPIGFVVSAFDFKYGWSNVPLWSVIISSVLFLIGYILYAEVMRENAYLSRVIEVQKDQKVIDTGLYGVVRHPMYLATLFMFLPMPIILGSFWGVIPFLLYPIIIVIRIRNEEKILEKGLEGYSKYKTKVKYRLIPFIW